MTTIPRSPGRTGATPALPLPDISIRQLEYLVAVAEATTWARAATTVGVSASALSQGLAELERRIGVALFDRDGRRRTIRPSAEPVVAHARQVLALTGDLARWVDRVRGSDAGQVRLGMIDVAALVHFPELLQQHRADHPDVDLLLRVAPSAELLALLGAGHLDLAVCVRAHEPPAGVVQEGLVMEELAVYGPPAKPPEPGRARPPARRSSGTVAAVRTWGPWVLFPTGSHTRALVMEQLASLGAPLDVVAESHQPEVLREMVRLGIGWTVLPRSQAEEGERPLLPGRRLVDRELVLARRTRVVVDPVVAELGGRLTAAAARRTP